MNQKKKQDVINFLNHKALQLRIDSMRATTASASGHPTSCFSAADIISALFFDILKYDFSCPHAPTNDRFILSKGHAIPIVYAALKQHGVISDSELLTLRQCDSVLEGHPTPRFAYNEAATGSLGQGLSIGLGMALHARMRNLVYKTYVMMGDGEIAEGSIWEAAELAAHYNLDNLVGIVDCNRLGQSGAVQHDHDVSRYANKFEAFGWHCIVIDGHDMASILNAFEQRDQVKNKPCMIIAKTIKGYGLDDSENKIGFHGKPIAKDELEKRIIQLEKRFADSVLYQGACSLERSVSHGSCEPTVLSLDLKKYNSMFEKEHSERFSHDKKISTRQAFGVALQALGDVSESVVALDADVKNSTYTDIFEKKYPNRFVQCFIAEQNMVGVATGLTQRGNIAFAATFGAFLARAHDQIRMAGVGRVPLRLCGSHCGVSIGQDGPSQMALEDIAMIRAMPYSIVLYPSDGVSTYKLVGVMADYEHGVSYIRTTRGDTPMLYNLSESFTIGGSKVLRSSDNDHAVIIAAGITVHEALKAYAMLQENGVSVTVIDCYSVKPLDVETVRSVASRSKNNVIVVEDHYVQGGLGEAVYVALAGMQCTIKHLAVREVPRSAAPDELLAWAGIDAQAIVQAL